MSEELSLPVDDPLGVTIWGENLVVTDGSAGSENVVVLDGKSETVSKRGTIAVDGGSPSLTGTAVEGGREGAFILRALEQSTGEAHEYSLEGDSQGGSVAMPGMTLKGLSFDPFALWMVASRDGEPDGFYRVDKSTGEPMTKGKGPSSPDALDVPGGTGWGIVYVEDAVWVCNPEQGKFHGYLWDIATAGDNGNELGSFSVPWDARGSTYDGELIWSVDVATGTLKGFEPPR